MLFTAVAILNGGRWILPALTMVAPSPLIFLAIQALQLLKPVMGAKAYQYIDEVIWSSFQRTVLCFFSNMNDTQAVFSGDYESFVKSKGNALVISNHQTNVDWICMDMLTLQPQVMGRMRYIQKDVLKYVPLFGLYFWQHGCINVGRYGKFQEDKTVNQLNYLKKENIPVWLVIFPEGTRYNPDNKKTILRSQQFAQENGFSVLHQTLTPRLRGTFLALQQLHTHLDAVYDVTIAYASTRQPSSDGEGFIRCRAPGMIDFILSYSPRLHIHIRKIDISSVPCHEPQTVASWLHQLYQGKDRMLERFVQTGQFEERDVVYRPVNNWSQTLPYNLLFLSFTALVLRYPLGRKLYASTAVLGSLAGIVWMNFH